MQVKINLIYYLFLLLIVTACQRKENASTKEDGIIYYRNSDYVVIPEPARIGRTIVMKENRIFLFSLGRLPYLYALDADMGTVLWKKRLLYNEEQAIRTGVISFQVDSAEEIPTGMAADWWYELVKTSTDSIDLSSQSGGVFRLRQDTGELIWSYYHKNDSSFGRFNQVEFQGPQLYLRGRNGVLAEETNTDQELWTATIPLENGSQGNLVGLAVSPQQVVYATSNRARVVHPLTGEVLQADLEFPSINGVYTDEKTVYVWNQTENEAALRAFAQGQQVWEFLQKKPADRWKIFFDREASHFYVFTQPYHDHFYILDTHTGKVLKQIQLKVGYISALPIQDSGKLYLAGVDLYELEASTGKVLKTFHPPTLPIEQIYTKPIVTANRIYFASDNGTFYCLDRHTFQSLWTFQVSQ